LKSLKSITSNVRFGIGFPFTYNFVILFREDGITVDLQNLKLDSATNQGEPLTPAQQDEVNGFFPFL